MSVSLTASAALLFEFSALFELELPLLTVVELWTRVGRLTPWPIAPQIPCRKL